MVRYAWSIFEAVPLDVSFVANIARLTMRVVLIS